MPGGNAQDSQFLPSTLSKIHCAAQGRFPIEWIKMMFTVHWTETRLMIRSIKCHRERTQLKTVDTVGNCQRLVFTVGVSQHMHKITNLWKFELNRSLKLRDIMKEKTPMSHEVVCFLMLDFETSNSKLEVSKNSWKITSFSKNTSLQRELFLTMFYTINLSPLLVTKKGFVMIIILSNYQ